VSESAALLTGSAAASELGRVAESHCAAHLPAMSNEAPNSAQPVQPVPAADYAPIPGLGHIVTVQQLADLLQVPLGTVYAWNKRGTGPTVWHAGVHARYYATDIKAWLDEKYAKGAA